MNNYFIKKNYHIITFIFLYFSIIFGFILGENTTLGPKNDFNHALKQVFLFEKNFLHTFLNYDDIEFPTRISPIFIIIIFFFKKIFIDIDLVRFIILNLLLLNQIYFYKCLKLVFFKNYKIDKKYLFILSCIIFLSPSFRSNIIWPESAMFGMLFFLISINYFLKFKIKFEINYIYLNIFFLALASYIRPSFAVFSIFFFIYYLLNVKDIKKIIQIIFFNLILAFPAFYYLFILDIFFIDPGLTPGNDINSLGINNSLNFSNKILIISSIIFFYSLPFIFYFKKFFLLKNLYLKEILILLLFSLINIYLFNYKIEFTGGGIFFKISNFLFGNNLVFFGISIYSILFIFLLFRPLKNLNNFLILFLLLISNPQLSIYHKYYDPLLLFLFFTIFEIKINKDYFDFRNILILNVFCISFLVMNFLK